MSCGTCPDSAQPTTRQDGTAPTLGALLWSADVGGWYRQQRAQGAPPAITMPMPIPTPASLPAVAPLPAPARHFDSAAALNYARQHGPSDESRIAASQEAYPAYRYALEVDHGPHPETRAGACRESPDLAVAYAVNVDHGPHDDTRAAACRTAETAFRYAWMVDHGARDDTRRAACREAEWAFGYAHDVDRGPHPDTWAAVQKSRSQKYGRPVYEREIGNP